MNKSFRQIFEEERQLSSLLAKHWGYEITNITLDDRFKRENQGKIPNVAHINALKLTKDIPKTQKIIQIEDQLRAIENGRLLSKFTEQANKRNLQNEQKMDQKSPIIKLMQQKVKQYNFIVNHKHLDKAFHEQTRKILKIDKEETQIIMDKIQEQQGKLKNANLSTQIHINKYLAQLYKSYRDKIDKNRSTSNKGFKTKTMISQPAKSGNNQNKHDEIPRIQPLKYRFNKQLSYSKEKNTKSDKTLLLSVQQSADNIHHTQAKAIHKVNNLLALKGNLTDRFANRQSSSHKRQRIEKTLYSPFLQKERLDQYRNIEKNNKNNYDTLGLFKNKISQVKTKNLFFSKEKKSKYKKKTNTQLSLQGKTDERQQIRTTYITNNNEPLIYNAVSKKKYDEQKLIFAQLLKKKHNKFNRVGLSKVLVKYDEDKEAKQLLKGDQMNKTIQNNQNSNKINRLSKITRFSKYQTVKIDSQIDYVFDDDENEDEHYQRMCKNEKINLLLKHK